MLRATGILTLLDLRLGGHVFPPFGLLLNREQDREDQLQLFGELQILKQMYVRASCISVGFALCFSWLLSQASWAIIFGSFSEWLYINFF